MYLIIISHKRSTITFLVWQNKILFYSHSYLSVYGVALHCWVQHPQNRSTNLHIFLFENDKGLLSLLLRTDDAKIDILYSCVVRLGKISITPLYY
jgi:hypothetical protein